MPIGRSKFEYDKKPIDMIRKVSLEIITALLVVLFLYAALSKLFDYERFYIQVNQSPLLTGLTWIPWLTIGVELLACILLIVPRLRVVGYFLSLGLMSAFTVYIVAVLKYSPFIPCSCGGILEDMDWNQHLLFNVSFVVVATIAIWLYVEEKLHNDMAQFKETSA